MEHCSKRFFVPVKDDGSLHTGYLMALIEANYKIAAGKLDGCLGKLVIQVEKEGEGYVMHLCCKD